MNINEKRHTAEYRARVNGLPAIFGSPLALCPV
jgi:hypothetical protein